MTLITVQDVHDRIANHYYPKDPERLRRKGNVANNTWAYPAEGEHTYRSAVVKYHNTEIIIAVLSDQKLLTPTLWLDHGGYKTPTTKQRLGWFLPAGVRIEGRNGSGFPDRWREGDWSLRLSRPLAPAYVPFDEALGLHFKNGMWRVWNNDEPYAERAEQVRRAAIRWVRRYRPDMLENTSSPGATWCADCTNAWPNSPTTRHLMDFHWQENSRRVYNRRQVYAALANVGVQAAEVDWIDPKIVRRALAALVPDASTITKILIAADAAFESDYTAPF